MTNRVINIPLSKHREGCLHTCIVSCYCYCLSMSCNVLCNSVKRSERNLLTRLLFINHFNVGHVDSFGH